MLRRVLSRWTDLKGQICQTTEGAVEVVLDNLVRDRPNKNGCFMSDKYRQVSVYARLLCICLNTEKSTNTTEDI